ncbi:head scaffolding protein [Pseudomonas phage vB_PpuP-Mora-5]
MTDEVVVQTAPEQAPAPAVTVEPLAIKSPVPAPEPAADKGKGKNEPEEIVYEQTGDAKLDLALGFFGRQGLDAEHPAIQAAANGDFSLLEAELASKDAKGWQQYVALAKESHGNHAKSVQEKEASITNAVAETLERHGYTNEQWGEAISWVRQEAAEDVPEINRMLASGPLAAKAITAFILANHREASGVEYTPQAKGVKDEAGANAGAAAKSLEPMSKAEFSREAEKLARAFGPDYMSRPEYKQIRARAGYQNR